MTCQCCEQDVPVKQYITAMGEFWLCATCFENWYEQYGRPRLIDVDYETERLIEEENFHDHTKNEGS